MTKNTDPDYEDWEFMDYGLGMGNVTPIHAKVVGKTTKTDLKGIPPVKKTPYKYVAPVPAQEGPDMKVITRESEYLEPVLFDLLSYKTPYGTEKIIRSIIVSYLLKLPHFNDMKIHTDDIGNLIVKYGGEQGTDYRTMFSSHMDTVHPRCLIDIKKGNMDAVKESLRQTLVVAGGTHAQKDQHFVYAANTKKDALVACVLGADDKAGIWLMLKLLEKQVAGLYVFHVGEEKGGIGSGYLAEETPDVVKGIDRCIAFDRAYTQDIITSQAGGVCASTEFGKAMEAQLDKDPEKSVFRVPNEWKSGVRGTFTDSANYTHLISECTNLSVGYYQQHTCNERLDWLWLSEVMLPAVLNTDWESLPVTRSLTVTRYQRRAKATTGSGVVVGSTPAVGFKSAADVSNDVLNKLCKTTMSIHVPKWDFDIGMITGVNREAMVRMISKSLEIPLDRHAVAASIYELLREIEVSQDELDLLQDDFDVVAEAYGQIEGSDLDELFAQSMADEFEEEVDFSDNLLYSTMFMREMVDSVQLVSSTVCKHEGVVAPVTVKLLDAATPLAFATNTDFATSNACEEILVSMLTIVDDLQDDAYAALFENMTSLSSQQSKLYPTNYEGNIGFPGSILWTYMHGR